MQVLLVMPASPGLAASAARGFTGGSREAGPKIIRDDVAAPADVSIDERFRAIPLGSGTASRGGFMGIAQQKSGRFVVRATVAAEKLADLSERLAADNTRIFADPQIGLFPTCGGDAPVGVATDVRGLLQVDELHRRGLNGGSVAIAVVDSGINLEHLRNKGACPRLDPNLTWSPTPEVLPGHYPVDHGTMVAFNTLISAPEATLLDFPVLQSNRAGGSIMDGFLSDALQAFSGMLQMLLQPAEARPYHALVVNNSWGMFHPSWDFPPGHPGRYADNPEHPFNIIVGSLAAAGADILFAAGNCGSECPDGRCQGQTTNTISGANSHPDVLSIAGADTAGNRVGYSSQGPGALTDEKPDITAYTHFLGSEAFGPGVADSGTSAACPVAAGVVAALRTRTRPTDLPPGDLAHLLRQTAVQPAGIPAGWNANTGHGIIRPLGAAGLANSMS